MAAQLRAALVILRRKQLEARTGRSKSSLYADIQAGLFVEPIRIGARAVGWLEHEADTIIAARAAGASDTEIRALVIELLAARKGVQ
jgi:prophage regulatory protein